MRLIRMAPVLWVVRLLIVASIATVLIPALIKHFLIVEDDKSLRTDQSSRADDKDWQ